MPEWTLFNSLATGRDNLQVENITHEDALSIIAHIMDDSYKNLNELKAIRKTLDKLSKKNMQEREAITSRMNYTGYMTNKSQRYANIDSLLLNVNEKIKFLEDAQPGLFSRVFRKTRGGARRSSKLNELKTTRKTLRMLSEKIYNAPYELNKTNMQNSELTRQLLRDIDRKIRALQSRTRRSSSHRREGFLAK